MRLILFDYGTGNLHSLRKALERQGAEVDVGADLSRADGLVLPGVGAFGAAARELSPHRDAIRAAAGDGLPVLGICLGMQLLLDTSEEGAGAGLGLIPGRVRRLRAERVPHMGWNVAESRDRLFAGLDGARFYFANSYVAAPGDEADGVAWTTHEGDRFPSALRRGSVFGTQFHPEKSGEPGLRLLGRFVDEVRARLEGSGTGPDRRAAEGGR